MCVCIYIYDIYAYTHTYISGGKTVKQIAHQYISLCVCVVVIATNILWHGSNSELLFGMGVTLEGHNDLVRLGGFGKRLIY